MLYPRSASCAEAEVIWYVLTFLTVLQDLVALDFVDHSVKKIGTTFFVFFPAINLGMVLFTV